MTKQKTKEIVFMILKLVSIVTLCILGIAMVWFSIIWLFSWRPAPDTRTIQEIKEHEYKRCLIYSGPEDVEECKNYLK